MNKVYKKHEIDQMDILPVLEEIKTPGHYHKNGIDVIGFSEKQFDKAELKGFHRINILKYVTRYDRKNGVEDLMKAADYLSKLIHLELGIEQHSNHRLSKLLELQEENLKLALEIASLKGNHE